MRYFADSVGLGRFPLYNRSGFGDITGMTFTKSLSPGTKTMTNWNTKTTAEMKTEMVRLFKENLEFLSRDCFDRPITMTAATVSIFGTSGRGNRTAVRIIETLAEYGYIEIHGNKKRTVRLSESGRDLAKKLPLENEPVPSDW
jgi:hypothetical protein